METRTRTYPSTLDSVTEASTFVLETAEAFGIPEEVTQYMLLVIGEAVANAAGHGNEFDPDKEIVVACSVGDNEAHICVQDQGAGITDEQLENAALPDDLMQTNGRGLFIMKSLADRTWLEDEGRRLCMAWHRISERA